MSKIPVNDETAPDSAGTSFEERSVWIQLISMSLVVGGYFITAGQMLSQGVTELIAYVPVFAGSVVLLVIVTVAGHIAVAIASRPGGRDERDRLIGWKAESHSGWLVAFGVVTGITGMIFHVPNVWVAHFLFLCLFLSEILKLVLQLVFYRRGV
jgi:hypothetical protein